MHSIYKIGEGEARVCLIFRERPRLLVGRWDRVFLWRTYVCRIERHLDYI